MNANEFMNNWKKVSELISDKQLDQLIQDINQINEHGIQIAFTFDYCGIAYMKAHHAISINIEGDMPYELYLWDISDKGERDDLYCQLVEELDQLNLSSGADDQYYDYNPSILECCLFLHWLLTEYKAPGYADYHIENNIGETFENFFRFCHDNNIEEDDEMLDSYQGIYQTFIKNEGYQEITCGWDHLKLHSFHLIK